MSITVNGWNMRSSNETTFPSRDEFDIETILNTVKTTLRCKMLDNEAFSILEGDFETLLNESKQHNPNNQAVNESANNVRSVLDILGNVDKDCEFMRDAIALATTMITDASPFPLATFRCNSVPTRSLSSFRPLKPREKAQELYMWLKKPPSEDESSELAVSSASSSQTTKRKRGKK